MAEPETMEERRRDAVQRMTNLSSLEFPLYTKHDFLVVQVFLHDLHALTSAAEPNYGA